MFEIGKFMGDQGTFAALTGTSDHDCGQSLQMLSKAWTNETRDVFDIL
jgi:hypothetical protein